MSKTKPRTLKQVLKAISKPTCSKQTLKERVFDLECQVSMINYFLIDLAKVVEMRGNKK